MNEVSTEQILPLSNLQMCPKSKLVFLKYRVLKLLFKNTEISKWKLKLLLLKLVRNWELLLSHELFSWKMVFLGNGAIKVVIAQLHLTFCDPKNCDPQSPLSWNFPGRILGWVVIPFCRGSSQARDQTAGLLHCRQILPLSHQRSVIVNTFIPRTKFRSRPCHFCVDDPGE